MIDCKRRRGTADEPTAACCFSPFFSFAMASFTSYTTRSKLSFPHAGNNRNFETNSSINNDHVNRLYNWQHRMEQKKQRLKQSLPKKILPHLLPPNILAKLAQARLGELSEPTHLRKAALCRSIGNGSAGQGKKRKKSMKSTYTEKMDWENYKTKSASTKLPNATIKAKNAPSTKNRSKVNSYSRITRPRRLYSKNRFRRFHPRSQVCRNKRLQA